MKQSNTNFETVDVLTFAKRNLRHPFFQIGYHSVIKNKPFDYSIDNRVEAIIYERGRVFAIWCIQHKQPRAIWRNGIPAKTLVERFIYATHWKIFL